MAAVLGKCKVPVFARFDGVEYPVGEFELDVHASGVDTSPIREFVERNG